MWFSNFESAKWLVCESSRYHSPSVAACSLLSSYSLYARLDDRAGMHKKSIEASQKLKEEEERTGDDGLGRQINDMDRPTSPGHGEEHRRTESIALLRAKAQSYSARMLHGLAESARITAQQCHSACSGFQTPSITTACWWAHPDCVPFSLWRILPETSELIMRR